MGLLLSMMFHSTAIFSFNHISSYTLFSFYGFSEHCVGTCPNFPQLWQKHAFISYATYCLKSLILIYGESFCVVSISTQTRAKRHLEISLVCISILTCLPISLASLKTGSLLKYSTRSSASCIQIKKFSFLWNSFLKFGLHCVMSRWYLNINHGPLPKARMYSLGTENLTM